ncbi:hypothetical protein ACFX15_019445 [Malus domestica]
MIVWVHCQHLCTEYANGLKTLRTRSLIMGGCIMALGSQWSSLEVVQLCRSNSSGFSVSSLAARLILWGKAKSGNKQQNIKDAEPRENRELSCLQILSSFECGGYSIRYECSVSVHTSFSCSSFLPEKAFGKVQTTVPLPVITDAENLQEAPVAILDRRMIKKVLQLQKP